MTAKKRKLASPPAVLPPDKKPVVKKESVVTKAPAPKPAANALAGTTPGKPLPSFARRKPLAAARPAAATAPAKAAAPAAPASAPTPMFDAFALSMADMQNEQKAKDGGPLPSAGPEGLAALDGIKLVRAGKKKKSVRWQTDDKLEQIKFFESIIDFTDEFGNSLGDQDVSNHCARAFARADCFDRTTMRKWEVSMSTPRALLCTDCEKSWTGKILQVKRLHACGVQAIDI